MKAPESLETLLDYGIIQEVVRPLMSGKEAHVFVVVAGGEECVAKVYKEAHQRTFKHRSDYTEGRRTRNTRDQRAMSKRTQHGRKKDEDAWRSTEVEMIYRLRDAGVRVPEPINFVEGVLVMELVKDAEGHAAPRLGDLTFSASEAHEIYLELMREVVRMLCAGVIHGDLSDFNVLMSHDGPVVIDFPQSVDPTQNPNGEKLLLRDVENLHRFLARFAPDEPVRPYGEEIWSLFKKNRLEPDTELNGRYVAPEGRANTEEVMALIEDASRDEKLRRGGREPFEDEEFDAPAMASAKARVPFRTVVDFAPESSTRPNARKQDGKKRGVRAAGSAKRRRRPASDEPVPPTGPAADSVVKGDASVPSRRRRRGRRRGSKPAVAREGSEQAPRNGTTAADGAKPLPTQRRRRARNGRSSTQAKSEAKPEASRTGSSTNGKSAAVSRAKRPATPARSLGDASKPGGLAGSGGPARRRRRRPRRVNSSE